MTGCINYQLDVCVQITVNLPQRVVCIHMILLHTFDHHAELHVSLDEICSQLHLWKNGCFWMSALSTFPINEHTWTSVERVCHFYILWHVVWVAKLNYLTRAPFLSTSTFFLLNSKLNLCVYAWLDLHKFQEPNHVCHLCVFFLFDPSWHWSVLLLVYQLQPLSVFQLVLMKSLNMQQIQTQGQGAQQWSSFKHNDLTPRFRSSRSCARPRTFMILILNWWEHMLIIQTW